MTGVGTHILLSAHEWVTPYTPPMGKGGSGGPIFKLRSYNTLELAAIHTYSYTSNGTNFVNRPYTIPTGGGIKIDTILKAIQLRKTPPNASVTLGS